MFLQFLRTADFQDLVRHDRTLGELLTLFHEIALEHNDVFGERDQMLFFSSGLGILQDQSSFSAGSSAHLNNSIDLCNLSRVLRPTRFK